MKTLRFLLEKEFKQMARHSFLPKLIVLFPTLMMCLLPWAANLEVKEIHLGVIDRDHSPLSNRLTHALEASGYFRLVAFPESFPRALEGVTSGATDVLLDIPPRFGEALERGEGTRVFIAPNSVNGTKGELAAVYLSAILKEFSVALRAASSPVSPAPAVEVATLHRFNARLAYKPFMVPALMVMLMMLLCGFLPALNIVGEKESGTIEQINVTPVGKFTFIAGKLIPYWLVGFAVLTYSFLLAWLFYDIVPVGRFGTIYLFALLFVFGIAGFGLIVSNHSATMQQAMFVMFFFIMIFVLMSGFFSPIKSMPGWARAIAAFNPLNYFVEVVRGVYLKGSGVGDMTRPLLALSSFAVIMNAWAVWSYRKSR
ncbi:MAG: ABC transporter permease [Odoribacteraceae bacterium]|jgi:ABC-2 type transport system permease protein|nr:ABC transporter permease [Odoribacteraceae bacterium]